MFIEEIKESVKLSSPRMGNKHACSEIMDTIRSQFILRCGCSKPGWSNEQPFFSVAGGSYGTWLVGEITGCRAHLVKCGG
jgi:hypothetical protein